MSKLFKSARVTLDDNVFILSSKEDQSVGNTGNKAEGETFDQENVANPIETANGLIQEAKDEAESILLEADQEAHSKVVSANESAEKIIANAYEQAKGIMESARQKGFQSGYDDGINESKEKADQIIGEALYIREEWIRTKESLEKEAEQEMVEIILDITEKVLNKHLQEDKDYLEELIKKAIHRVNKSEQLTLRVSKEDYNQALSLKPMILAMSDRIDDIEIREDLGLENGACIIDTDSGSIDSSIWTQFEQIKSIFEDLLKSE